MIVSLLEESPPARVHAALTRDGVEVYGDHVNLQPLESKPILLQVVRITQSYPNLLHDQYKTSFSASLFDGNNYRTDDQGLTEKKNIIGNNMYNIKGYKFSLNSLLILTCVSSIKRRNQNISTSVSR